MNKNRKILLSTPVPFFEADILVKLLSLLLNLKKKREREILKERQEMYFHCCKAKQLHNAQGGGGENDFNMKVLDSGKFWIIHTVWF